MNAVIITIGDEILYGQTIDTNSAWIAQQLNVIGINILSINSISDNKEEIIETLNNVLEKVDLVLITGGLGPTRDDLTKYVLCEFFNTRLVFNPDVYADIEERFSKRGIELLEANKMQAEVPEKCIPIRNKRGTAPGMYFEEKGKIIVSMPGVPHEMKGMMADFVISRLKDSLNLPYITHAHISTVGIAESVLSEKLQDFEDRLPEHIKMAYLPELSKVKLRLTAKGGDEARLIDELEILKAELNQIIPEYIYSFQQESLEMVVGELLRMKKAKVAIAESCTGGFVAHRLTSEPGSSKVFDGGLVTYSNEVKMKELGVKKSTLDDHGAVSEATVREMVMGVIDKFKADYGVATSGIAGPDGGTEDKPVGTIWVAVGDKDTVIARKFLFKGDREQNIQLSGITALNMLRKFLKGQLV